MIKADELIVEPDSFFDDFTDDLFEIKEEVRYLDVHALVLANELAGRKHFNADLECRQLGELLKGELPKSDEVFKIIAGRQGFSCVGLVKYIAEIEPIEELLVTTFRCNTENMMELDELHNQGKLKDLKMVVSRIAKGEKMGYFKECLEICNKNGWQFGWCANHSKLTLAKTADNYYYFETSANFNENPRLEQYSFENNKQTYEFYKQLIEELLNLRKGA